MKGGTHHSETLVFPLLSTGILKPFVLVPGGWWEARGPSLSGVQMAALSYVPRLEADTCLMLITGYDLE